MIGSLPDGVLQEIVEETNVPRSSLSEPRLIGCMADSVGKPDILFWVVTTLDAAAVRAAYAEGAEDGWESDRMLFVSVSALGCISQPLCPVTRAAIQCYLAARGCRDDNWQWGGGQGMPLLACAY